MITSEHIDFLLSQGESEYLDFKEIFHTNNANLIHDILCLANAEYSGDRYLIFGVRNNLEIIGLSNESPRKTQSQLVDLLRSSYFNHLPTIILKTILYRQLEIDVLQIKNRPEKPYFLLRDYRDGQTHIRAGAIYTRNGDTNTPINQCADDIKIERMYKERFSLDKAPLERAHVYLRDIANWKYGYDHKNLLYFYYSPFPEFTISQKQDSNEELDEPWVLEFPNKKASKDEFYLMFHATILDHIYLVWCDGARYLIVMPEQAFLEHENGLEYTSYYFINESIELLVSNMVQSVYPSHNRNSRIDNIFSYFDSNEIASQNLKMDLQQEAKMNSFYHYNREKDQYFRYFQNEYYSLFSRK